MKNYSSGTWQQIFNDLIISASDKIRHPFLGKVQDFDFSRMVPYSPEYLAGIPAERYTVGLNEGWERTKKMMEERIKKSLNRKLGLTLFLENLTTNYYDVKFRYLLAPVYFASYRYKKKKMLVVINGQTGKTFCYAPTFIPKIVISCIIILLVLLILFLVFVVFPYLR